MTHKEKWEKIVELHLQQQYLREEIVQKTWENIFSQLFGYTTLFDEIDIQRSIQVGSTERVVADIIIKDKEKDLFIVEIKQQTLDTGDKQLLSYLKLLRVDIGVLINKKITVFIFDYKKQDHEQIKYDVLFDRDSTDGELFVELFSKPFQSERVRELIIQKKNSNKHVQEIKELLNEEYIRDLFKAELSKKYSQNEIIEALKQIEFKISEKHKIVDKKDPLPDPISRPTKIGQVVQNFFSKASRENSISKELIQKLCDKNYCNLKFNISLAVLKEVFDLNQIDILRKDSHGYARYYKELYKYNGKIYILCSQWTTAHERKFYEWKRLFEANIIT